MFKFLAIIISVILTIIILLAIFYFLPTDTKLKTLQAVTGIVPESIKKGVEELVLTPPEKRAKILRELKDNLAEAERLVAENETNPKKTEKPKSELAETIKKAEELVAELERRNGDASLTNIITAKLADKLVGEVKNEPAQNNCQCRPEQ